MVSELDFKSVCFLYLSYFCFIFMCVVAAVGVSGWASG